MTKTVKKQVIRMLEKQEQKESELSFCGKYRYSLSRIWDDKQPRCYWIMLNPSTADALKDDPTIRRVKNYSKAWGFGGCVVYNLFALRATDPKELLCSDYPVGEHNDTYIKGLSGYPIIIAAWGGNVPFGRDKEVLRMLKGTPIYCLDRTKEGHPRHPLYCKKNLQRKVYTC